MRAIRPFARRYGWSGRYGVRRYGSPWYRGYRRPGVWGRPWYGGARPWYRGARPWYGGRPWYAGAGVAAPEPEPDAGPPPPQPGFRWVAVPIGAPPPIAGPPPPMPTPPSEPEPAPSGPGAAPPPGGASGNGGSPQSEFGYFRDQYGPRTAPSGRWVRRAGKIVLLDV